MKIAWGITGAGHYLRESVQCIKKLVSHGHILDIFLSKAAKVVCEMYDLISLLKNIHLNNPKNLINIYYDSIQEPAFPICARFNLAFYDCLVLSPITSNSASKMNIGIADTLITNIFAQMIKGEGIIYAVPCDLIPGKVETETPNGKKICITIDNFNSQNAQNLKKFPKVKIYKTPSEILNVLEQG